MTKIAIITAIAAVTTAVINLIRLILDYYLMM